ncbi:MAG TPA: DUF2585 family protein [Pyrinomonadaceae bacterium]|jgi:hypothetical protein|nr:DUF2585 family protein [Pyrinomonadaceae bacterium]
MSKKLWPWLAVLAVTIAAAIQLGRQGRAWFCACGRVLLWTSEAWSANTSQHLLDPYSFTHMLHGFVFCGLLAWWGASARLSWPWRLWFAVAAEALWEIFENTEFVVGRYRENTMALGYEGDTIFNSLGDMLACALGFLLARLLGWRRALAVFALTEIVLLIWIRDSLLLSVLMLIYPVDALKAWQAGH